MIIIIFSLTKLSIKYISTLLNCHVQQMFFIRVTVKGILKNVHDFLKMKYDRAEYNIHFKWH